MKGNQNMKPEIQAKTKHNDFYPNCGCESELECEPCKHCGMCAATVDYCACCHQPSGTDKNLHYDPHRETMGG